MVAHEGLTEPRVLKSPRFFRSLWYEFFDKTFPKFEITHVLVPS